jgi:hypothetical protein
MILDGVVRPPTHEFSDFRPAVAQTPVGQQQDHFFEVAPFLLVDVGVQVVMPSFPALLPDATWLSGICTWQVLCDYRPFLGTVLADEFYQVIVLFCRPRFFLP